MQFNKDDERVKLVNPDGDDESHDDVNNLELSDYYLESNSNGYQNNLAPPSWVSSLDEFRYEAFSIREKSKMKHEKVYSN